LTCAEKLPLKGSKPASAIEIQRWYLKQCESLQGLDADDLDVLSKWSCVLDDLARDPMKAADRIDWVTKLQYLMNPLLRKNETSWVSVAAWGDILSHLRPDEVRFDGPVPERVQREFGPTVESNCLDWSEFGKQLKIYYELRERDLRYHDVDVQKGLFSILSRQGRITVPFTEAAVAEAQSIPPLGRARVRARLIEWAFDNGRLGETTLDWDKAMLPGHDGFVRFPDPCSCEDENLERKIRGEETPAGIHIRILSTSSPSSTVNRSSPETGASSSFGNKLRRFLKIANRS
jgi:hypothetical protein